MATGKAHEFDSGVLAIILLTVFNIYLRDFMVAVLVASGALAGIYITPDLDVDGWIRSKRKATRSLGLVGYAWFVFWYPYSKAIRHRNWLSHAPLIGTMGRIVYLLTIPLTVAMATHTAVSGQAVSYIAIASVGLACSDIIHWLRDGRPLHK